MSRPRKRLFGPLFYSTLVVAALVSVYAAILNAPPVLENVTRTLNERKVVKSLSEALRSTDPALREQAAQLLVSKGLVVAVPILKDATGDPRGEVRALACRYLAEAWADPAESVSVLVAAASDDREDVRLEAARGLGRAVRYRLAPAGASSSSGASGGPSAVLRDDALRTLRRLLDDSSSLVQAEAAGSLGEFGPSPAVSADLTAAVGGDDRAVRLAAARSLLKLNGPDDPAAARALIAMLADPEAVPDRAAVLQVVSSMSESVQDQAVAALVGLLSRAGPDVIPDVIASFPFAGPRARTALPALEALLDQAEPSVRAGAALAIIAIETRGGMQAMPVGTFAGMSGPGAGGSMGAMSMMMSMGPRAGGGNPASGSHANPKVVATLARIVGDAAISPEIRGNALGMIPVADAPALAKTSAELVRQLTNSDPNVRRAAIELLSRIVTVTPASLPAASGAK